LQTRHTVDSDDMDTLLSCTGGVRRLYYNDSCYTL